MNALKSFFVSVFWLFILLGVVRADEVEYDLDRIVTWTGEVNVEVEQLSGHAIIYDSGPYTVIEHITVEVNSCNSLFSPAPPCEPTLLYIDERTDGYLEEGRVYLLESGERLTFIRRGSVETGDASLILFVDGSVFIFKQVII